MQILNNGGTENESSPFSVSRVKPPGRIPTVDHLQGLATSLQRRAINRKRALLRMLESMPRLIRELDPGFLLYGRIKNIESISNKMLDKNLDVSQVLDIIGIRAIIKHERNCYCLIRRVHSEFPFLASKYDDYIAAPKPNGYRSIHTTVVSPCGFAVEIQVRTQAMHEICERGSAAHSVYKVNPVAWMSFSHGPSLGKMSLETESTTIRRDRQGRQDRLPNG